MGQPDAASPHHSPNGVLVIRAYAAVSAPTITGGTTPDRTQEFREAARTHLPVASFTAEPHDVTPDLFGDSVRAELESDRLPLSQFMAFVEENARLLGTDELRHVNVGIDARRARGNPSPRSITETAASISELVEIRFPDAFTMTNIEWRSAELASELSWIVDSAVFGGTTVLHVQGGSNDLVVRQALELVELLEQNEIPIENVTITC